MLEELAVLIEGALNIRVEKLTTCCSVGVGQSIHELFAREVLSKRNLATPFKLVVLRNGGSSESEVDYIPSAGGSHLGATLSANAPCNIELTYLGDSPNVAVDPLHLPMMQRVKHFLNSFKAPHGRQTTLGPGPFYWKTIEEERELKQRLQVGNELEPVRKVVASVLSVFTCCLFSRGSFRSLYENEGGRR